MSQRLRVVDVRILDSARFTVSSARFLSWSPCREQAHLPAEQPPPCQDSRLPAAHAHAGGTSHSCRASRQGSDQTVGLSLALSMLPAAHRVRRRDDFAAAVRAGRRVSRPTLVAHYCPAPPGADTPARAGFVVSRAVGNAVVRNSVRRRLRELVRRHMDRLPPGSTLIVRATLPPLPPRPRSLPAT